MMLPRCFVRRAAAWALLVTPALMLAPLTGAADEPEQNHLRFQRPGKSSATAADTGGVQFRAPSAAESAASAPADGPSEDSAAEAPAGPNNPLRSKAAVVPASATARPKAAQAAARPSVQSVEYDQDAPRVAQAPVGQRFAKPISAAPPVAQPRVAEAPSDYRQTVPASSRRQAASGLATQTPDYRPRQLADLTSSGGLVQTSFCSSCLGGCQPLFGGKSSCDACCEPACGTAEPTCGTCEPGCGVAEPACGVCEPACGVSEPACGVCEPTCGEPSCGTDGGCDSVGCGNCVGNPGPDYWCFPVCFPRFKELDVWGGVHGFKGPRDAPAFGGPGDGNFGFQEGVNIGGRAPFIGLLFPQLSYQLGYQAVQSQLSGNSVGSTNDRSQQFITAGLFRRVTSGLQFGLAWDHMQDDFINRGDFDQLRYEISLKSPEGREIGFWGATHVSDDSVATGSGTFVFQSVNQYCGFLRWNFGGGGTARMWGGGTDDNEGIFGADFNAPFNARWSLQSGFNYLITNLSKGTGGAREESWNVGLNIVWHYGLTAKAGQSNPFAPLFETADNGWMFIDQKP